MRDLHLFRVILSRVLTVVLLSANPALFAAAQVPPSGDAPPGIGPGGPGGGLFGMGPPPALTQAKVRYPGGVTGLFDVTYGNAPGFRPLTLDLYYKPADHAAKPVVVWIHGGGFAGGTARMAIGPFGPFDKVLARLAARGYVTAAVNYRLSGEARFPVPVQDVKAAVRWLRANAGKYGIDPKRIAVWGESAGGYLAAVVATSCGVKELEGSGNNAGESSCVQAAVDWYGPTDFPKMDAQQTQPSAMKHSGPSSSESVFLGCELSACSPDLLRLASPVSLASAESPPFLIMHGDSDVAVPWKQSQELRDALAAKGVPVTFTLLPGLNHIFGGATPLKTQEILHTVFDYLDATFRVKPGTSNSGA